MTAQTDTRTRSQAGNKTSNGFMGIHNQPVLKRKVQELAKQQSRSLSGQLVHLLNTHPDIQESSS